MGLGLDREIVLPQQRSFTACLYRAYPLTLPKAAAADTAKTRIPTAKQIPNLRLLFMDFPPLLGLIIREENEERIGFFLNFN